MRREMIREKKKCQRTNWNEKTEKRKKKMKEREKRRREGSADS